MQESNELRRNYLQGVLMSKIGKINISIPKVKVVMWGSILNIEGPMEKNFS